jgi:hypothetical protein
MVEDRAVAHLARAAARSIRLGDAPRRARVGPGKSLFEVKANDRIVLLAPALARAVFAEPEPEAKPAQAKRPTRGKGGSSKKGKATKKSAPRRPAAKRQPAVRAGRHPKATPPKPKKRKRS